MQHVMSITCLISCLCIVVLTCSLPDLSQKMGEKVISFAPVVGNTIIFCISFDRNSLIDRKLLSRWSNNFIPVLKAIISKQ